MPCKIHLATDGRGGPLGLVLTGGNAADTTFFIKVLETIEVRDGRPGRPRSRPDRVLTDMATPPRPTAATWPAAATRSPSPNARTRRGAVPDADRRVVVPDVSTPRRTRAATVVERCFNQFKQWRGIATRFDKTARSYLAGLALAATLIWTR